MRVDIPIVGDVKDVLREMIAMVRESPVKPDANALGAWWETIDGWRNEMPDASGYSCVQVASDTLALYDGLCAAKRRIWELEQDVKRWKPIALHAASGINAKE